MRASYERTKIIRQKYVKYFDKAKPILEVGFGDGMLMKRMVIGFGGRDIERR